MRIEFPYYLLILFLLFAASTHVDAAAIVSPYITDVHCKISNDIRQPGETFLWTGVCKDGLISGTGFFRLLRNGVLISEYQGSYILGLRFGEGVLLSSDGSRYEGNFSDGHLNGRGIFVSAKGMRYEGDFVGDLFEGKGSYTWLDGKSYQGDFSNGMFNGRGVLNYPNGDRYSGDFVNDKFHGKGVLTYANGDRYAGDFANGKFHGKGVFTYANGERYRGYYINGEQSEVGVPISPSAFYAFDNPVLKSVHPELASRVTQLEIYVQTFLGLQVTYTSGFRDAERNAAVGGINESLHKHGLAVDLVISGLATEQEFLVADAARRLDLSPLWHGDGDNHHLHLESAGVFSLLEKSPNFIVITH